MKIDVKHIAKLANLNVSEKDAPLYEKQLSEVLNYIDRLNEVDVTGVEPTGQVTGLENISRTDEARKSLSQKQALSEARHKHEGLFMVKGIFDNE